MPAFFPLLNSHIETGPFTNAFFEYSAVQTLPVLSSYLSQRNSSSFLPCGGLKLVFHVEVVLGLM